MNTTRGSLPSLRADLILLHAPAFFDFRDRRDIYFPFLGTSGDVPITPLYEYFPLGFKTLQRFLGNFGYTVRIVNVSTVLLRYPGIDFDVLVRALDAHLIGIDLHWMVHVQGSLALAERIKGLRPEVPIVFGGISSTYYAEELIHYPFVDMVMRGYDTHEPMAALLTAIRKAERLHGVSNLLWKSADGCIHDNGFSHTPDSFGCGIDWSQRPEPIRTRTLPIQEILSTQNAGCAYNCPWCGGSREAFRRINRRTRAMARKPIQEVSYEFDSLSRIPGKDQYYFYSVGSYNESKSGMDTFLDHVGRTRLRSISYEQFHLTPDSTLARMVDANKRTTITLSPESHDRRISKLAGRGVYSNAELEAWLDKALGMGINRVDIWYFVGMPEQDERSVMETVEYCRHLMCLFKGRPVNPMICPMIPFLDPASTFFENPDRHGYRVFYRTVEQHRRAMERASLVNRINYETRWLSRFDLVRVGFNAVRSLMEAKAEVGFLPRGVVNDYNRRIEDALEFTGVVHRVDCIKDPIARAGELDLLGSEILKRNQEILFSGVMNQALPINRQIGGRWFDELGWEARDLEAAQGLVTCDAALGDATTPGAATGARARFPMQHDTTSNEDVNDCG